MTINLTTTELDILTAKRAQAQSHQIGYWEIYKWLADTLESKGVASTDQTVLWLRGATEANAGRGAMSELIRAYTETQYQLRYGTPIPGGQMQVASNAVAENLIKDLLGLSEDGWPRGQVPDINRIAKADATAVGLELFSSKLGHDETDTAFAQNSAWSGTLLFSVLQSDQTGRLMSTGTAGNIDTLNDFRDVLYAYKAYSDGFSAAVAAKLSQPSVDGPILGYTAWGYITSNATFSDAIDAGWYGTDNPTLKAAFKVIAEVGINKFLDMVMGATVGKSEIGSTTDANFSSRANTFFNGYGSTLKAIGATWLPTAAASLAALAKADVNVRAALAGLSVVSVQVSTTTAQRFDLHNPATDQGQITDKWITDRAAFTAALYQDARGTTMPGSPLGIRYADLPSNTELRLGSGTTGPRVQVLFGGDGADTVDGQGEGDRLYGGDGSDTLDGKAGDDYLEGGSGNDTLLAGEGSDQLLGGAGNDKLDGGDGADTLTGGADFDTYLSDKYDTIKDTDGKGVVNLGTTKLGLAERKKGETDYKDSAGNIYAQSGTTLTINGGLKILEWKDGDLGITLKEKDVDDIKKKYKTAETIPSPIALDLDGDGVETTAVTAGTHFDHAADGFAEATGWIAADDGLLVRDINGNGTIDSGKELFGSETLLAGGTKAANGFEALRELDSNQDGKVDAVDVDFASLRVWKDANGNGLTDAGELLALVDAGVQSINVAYTSSTAVDAQGNEHRQVGSFTTTTGATRSADDVWFKVDRTYAIATDVLTVPDDIAALPDASGYGKVRDLRQTMVRDTTGTLKALVTQFTQATTAAERQTLLQSIIYKWAGVENVDPNSRAATQIYGNVIGDARKLEALEEFMGEEWFGVWCWGTRDPNPHGGAAPVLLQAYAELAERIYSELAAGSYLKPLFDGIRFYREEGGTAVHGDLTAVAVSLTDAINLNRSAGKEMLGEFLRALKGTDLEKSVDLIPFGTNLGGLGADVLSVFGPNFTAQVNQYWAAANVLTGTDGADSLQGMGGNDTLTGNGGNDVLDGGADNDILYGNAGDDYLAGGRGTDQLYGGSGVDAYYFGRGDGKDTIHEDYLEDTYITIGDLTLAELTFARVGADLVVGFTSSAADNITLADFFKNGEPQSALVLKKDDGTTQTLNASALIQLTLSPTEGSDVLDGSSLADTINALGGDDLVFARGGNDIVDGGAGADNINGGDGNDQLSGGLGNDRLYGEAGADTLLGGDGNDQLFGGADADNLAGGQGDDVLDGGTGADTMAGGIGNDGYFVDNASDTVTELANEGVDTVNASVSVVLSANVENAILAGTDSINASGNVLNNTLTGNAGANEHDHRWCWHFILN